MLGKTFERGAKFGGVAFSVAAVACLMLLPGSTAAAARTDALVQIAVHNDAKMDAHVLGQAETIGTEVFAEAGLGVEWLNCGRANESAAESQACTQTSFPTHLQLRILRRPRELPEFTFGLSYLDAEGIGCYSEVFAARVGEMSAKTGQSASIVLGHVMAHEVAHLLLGTNSHAASGIMKARWQAAELAEARRGELRFTSQQSAAIRRKALLGGICPNEAAH